MADNAQGTGRIEITFDDSKLKSQLNALNKQLTQVNNNAKRLQQTFNTLSRTTIKNPFVTSLAGARQYNTEIKSINQNLQTISNKTVKDPFVKSDKSAKTFDQDIKKITSDTQKMNSALKSTDTSIDFTDDSKEIKNFSLNLESADAVLEAFSKTSSGAGKSVDILGMATKGGSKELGAFAGEAGAAALGLVELSDPIGWAVIALQALTGVLKAAGKAFAEFASYVVDRSLPNPFEAMKDGADMLTSSLDMTSASMLALHRIVTNLKNTMIGAVKSFTDLDATVREMTFQFSTLAGYSHTVSIGFNEMVESSDMFGDSLNTIKLIAGATAFTLQDSASALLELSKSGLSANTALTMVSYGMLSADMNGMDLTETLHGVTGVMNQFGMDIKNSATAGADFVTILNKMQVAADMTASDMDDLIYGLGYLAPVASNVGMSINDAIVAIAILGDMGLEASKGARVLASGLLNLTAPTDAASSAMKELGVDVYDANGNFVGLTETIHQLADGLDGLTDEQRASKLKDIFGKTAIKSWGSMINMSIEDLDNMVTALENVDSGLDYTAAKFAMVSVGIPTSELEEFVTTLGSLETQTEKVNFVMDEMLKYNPGKWLEVQVENMQNAITILGGKVVEDLANGVNAIIESFEKLGNALRGNLGLSELSNSEFFGNIAIRTSEILLFSGAIALLAFSFKLLAKAMVGATTVKIGWAVLKEANIDAQDLANIITELVIPAFEKLATFVRDYVIPVLGDVFEIAFQWLLDHKDQILAWMDSYITKWQTYFTFIEEHEETLTLIATIWIDAKMAMDAFFNGLQTKIMMVLTPLLNVLDIVSQLIEIFTSDLSLGDKVRAGRSAILGDSIFGDLTAIDDYGNAMADLAMQQASFTEDAKAMWADLSTEQQQSLYDMQGAIESHGYEVQDLVNIYTGKLGASFKVFYETLDDSTQAGLETVKGTFDSYLADMGMTFDEFWLSPDRAQIVSDFWTNNVDQTTKDALVSLMAQFQQFKGDYNEEWSALYNSELQPLFDGFWNSLSTTQRDKLTEMYTQLSTYNTNQAGVITEMTTTTGGTISLFYDSLTTKQQTSFNTLKSQFDVWKEQNAYQWETTYGSGSNTKKIYEDFYDSLGKKDQTTLRSLKSNFDEFTSSYKATWDTFWNVTLRNPVEAFGDWIGSLVFKGPTVDTSNMASTSMPNFNQQSSAILNAFNPYDAYGYLQTPGGTTSSYTYNTNTNDSNDTYIFNGIRSESERDSLISVIKSRKKSRG